MQILIAGRDRTSDLGPCLHPATGRSGVLTSPPYAPQDSALALRQARDVSEYQEILLRLMRLRRAIDTRVFVMPRKPGVLGGLFAAGRLLFWKALRYQHDHMAFRQNTLNESMISAIEFERRNTAAELADLRGRLEVLERSGRPPL